jgi:hypothetical protein
VRILDDKAGMRAIPSYGGLRLWEDTRQVLFPSIRDTPPMAHYSGKKRIRISSAGVPEAFPILAVVILSAERRDTKNQNVSLEELPRRTAFIEMMKQTFLLDVNDHQRYSQHMQALGRVILSVKSFRLQLPHDYRALPQVRRLILEQVAV